MAAGSPNPARRKRRLPRAASAALAAIAGILAAEHGGTPAVWSALLAAAAVWFGWRAAWGAWLASLFAGFALLHALALQHTADFPSAALLAQGQRLEAAATGIVADAPVVREDSARFPVILRTLGQRGGEWRLGAKIMVRVRTAGAAQPLPQCGDLVELHGLLSAPEPPRNPGQFDAAQWLRRQNISAELRARTVTVLEPAAGLPLRSLALRCRDWIARAITQDITDQPAEAAAVKAMVLGVREDMPEEIDASFLHSGTLHIFSVSGLHVGLVAVLIWKVLNLLRCGRRHAALASIPLVFAYALLTGWQPAAVRSALMCAIVLAGICLNRPPAFFNSLCLAALAILAMDTQQLFSAGAQLSFLVIGAIAALSPWFNERFRPLIAPDAFLPRPLWSRWQRCGMAAWGWLAGMMATSLAASVGSLPLTVWHFQLGTPVALVANLVHVPLAFFILATAGASALLSPFSAWLSAVLNNANWVLAKICLITAGWFEAAPGGYFLWNPRDARPAGSCQITVFDVGSGGAALIRTPSGKAWLLDAGRPTAFRSLVRAGLQYHAVKKLDGLILSHPDHDHVGGGPECLALLQPASVWHPPMASRSPAYTSVLQQAGEKARALAEGDVISLDEHTTVRVLFPTAEATTPLADDGCLVLLLECRGRRVLFSNDAGFIAENTLLRRQPRPSADVWVRGRHASDLSGLGEFHAALQPAYVVCASADFPPEERLPAAWAAMAEAGGSAVFDQALTGAVEITITSDAAVTARPFLAAPAEP